MNRALARRLGITSRAKTAGESTVPRQCGMAEAGAVEVCALSGIRRTGTQVETGRPVRAISPNNILGTCESEFFRPLDSLAAAPFLVRPDRTICRRAPAATRRRA